MKQKSVMLIEEYEQLKAISDPFRTKILSLLIEKSYTGQQLAQLLDLSRSKIHYHLNELEKNGFIAIVRKEEKNGILQKFYKAVARGFIPSEKLLPYQSEVGDYHREMTLNVLNRARIRTLSAPEETFEVKTSNPEQWPRIAMQLETKINEEEFVAWIAKYRKLLEDFKEMKDDNGKWYYLTTVGFQMDEPYFEDNHDLQSEDKS
jgi:DNA-binding transcriptional ArsR family regulator